jgi:mono/diheme cytochrome c family protein
VAGAYPALAGNRALLIEPPVNLVQVIAHGGFAPVTAGNPRPYGMPPFGLTLNHRDIAALVSYLRSAWGHRAPAVSPLAVQRWREATPR